MNCIQSMYHGIINDMSVIHKDVHCTLEKNMEYTRNQINYKLNQLENTLSKLDKDNKQDKLSALIESVLGSF